MNLRNRLMDATARWFPTHLMGERRWLAALWRTFFYAIGPTAPFRFRTRDYEMYAVPDRWHLSRTVIRQGYWESYITEIVRTHLRPGMLVADVGANYGHYAMTAANLVGPDGLVLAFEPIPSVYEDLSRNATLTRHDNVRTFPIALGAVEGEADLVVDSSSSGWSSLVENVVPSPGERTRVQVRRLSDIIHTVCPSRRLSVLKIDTEGFEAQVIAGAWDVLERDRPLVIMEFSDARIRSAGEDPDKLLERLLTLGYRARIIDEANERLLPVAPPVGDWPERYASGLVRTDDGWFTDLLLEPGESE